MHTRLAELSRCIGWTVGWFATLPLAFGSPVCRLEVVERGSGWPVPLVELRTTHQVRFVSDNAGVIAFDLPELMGRETWFDVIGHGYEAPADGFGYRGVRLRPEPGETLKVEVVRTSIARRLGRITGAGLFAESQQCGLASGVIETGVLGCDSVQVAGYQGKLFWLWGDTTVARYPLGLFHATGATTPLSPLTRFEPPVHIEFNHFTDAAGQPRNIARMPGDGPTWLTALISVADTNGVQRLVAAYMKVHPPLEAYEWGLCEWNKQTRNFDHLQNIWTKGEATPTRPPMPDGHAVLWRDAGEKEWVLFGNPLPTLRCPATFEAWSNTNHWEVLTRQEDFAVDGTSDRVKPHSGSIAWNPWRKRWVTVFVQHFGRPSMFGEVWYAEAATPTGPWGRAVKILSHENYTFYNPRLHAEFTRTNSPVLLFEGTFSQMFADRPPATPRHDYNQILYRLDLDDARLLPARVE